MSSFDSSSEEEGILKKALDVELPDDFDPSKAPTNGEEYIHHVMYERRKYRKWVTANIDRSKFKNKETIQIQLNKPIAQAPSRIVPTKKWQEHQVADFLKLRQFVAFNTQSEPTRDLVHASHWQNRLLNEKPTFSQLTSLKQHAKVQLLATICEYLRSRAEDGAVNGNVGVWIYSTLATLELPLHPSDCHELRELAKEMAAVRADLLDGATEAEYKYLNLCICLIARVFGQGDLADV